MRVAFCFNLKRNLPLIDPQAQIDAEFDAPETISAIEAALISGGHSVLRIEANEKAYLELYQHRLNIDIVFNIAEGVYGDAREAQIPAICDLLQIPYTHSSALSHAISLDKALTKKVLAYEGIKTAQFQVFNSLREQINPKLHFPLLLKPNAEGSSKGITDKNLVKDKKTLRTRLEWLLSSFHGSILAEEFLSGREFTVAILGNPPQVLPIIEQRLDIIPEKYGAFASYEVKWLWEDTLANPHDAYRCPAQLTNQLQTKIEKMCLHSFNALNCRDVARIDVRLDKQGEPHILEINTIPGMIPDERVISYFPIAARAAGLGYNKMVLTILDLAAKRHQIKP